ncbi:hypothetical protein [Geminocystis sp. GBBB08]|nr:hypothetical protein [Geminocystis sp. GBBB08]
MNQESHRMTAWECQKTSIAKGGAVRSNSLSLRGIEESLKHYLSSTEKN